MLTFFRSSNRYESLKFPFLTLGGLLTVVGIAVLLMPELLAYFVASILIVIGVSLLHAGWQLRQKR